MLVWILSLPVLPFSYLVISLLGETRRATSQAHRTAPHMKRLALGLDCRYASELGLLCTRVLQVKQSLCDG